MGWLALYLYALGAVFSFGTAASVSELKGTQFNGWRAAVMAISWPVTLPIFLMFGAIS